MGERGINRRREIKRRRGINQVLEQPCRANKGQQPHKWPSPAASPHWIHPLNLFCSPFLLLQAKKDVTWEKNEAITASCAILAGFAAPPALRGVPSSLSTPHLTGQKGKEIHLWSKRGKKKLSKLLSLALQSFFFNKNPNKIITFISGNRIFLSPGCVRISCFFL